MIRACDLFVSGGIFFLLVFAPLAFGAVHPWAYTTIEGAICLMFAAWMAKLAIVGLWHNPLGLWLKQLAAPLLAFVLLIAVQTAPLPAPVVNFLSPATYKLYSMSLPGWPARDDYRSLAALASTAPRPVEQLPTPEQVRDGVPIPYSSRVPHGFDENAAYRRGQATADIVPSAWRPLSVARSLTIAGLLKFASFAALFFIVALYRFGNRAPRNRQVADVAETGFLRSVVIVILVSGALIAALGIVQKFSGNGKILWYLVPQDWGTTNPGTTLRASGPFINPNHFACFLTLIFPLALSCATGRVMPFGSAGAHGFRVLAAFTCLLLVIAILLSLSRIGWINLGLAGVLLILLFQRFERDHDDLPNRHKSRAWGWVVGGVLLLLASLVLIGPDASQALRARLTTTIAGDIGISDRFRLWQDTLSMIGQFPLFGVGLGAWPELYPAFQSSPWTSAFYREAHNDYLQLIAESGLLGTLALSILLYQIGRLLMRGYRYGHGRIDPLWTACLTALLVLAVHENFDFNLQIPAIATLFAIMLGLVVRMTAARIAPPKLEARPLRPYQPVIGAALAMTVFIIAFSQEVTLGAGRGDGPMAITGAVERIRAFPARPSGHIELARLLEHRAAADRRLQEYEVAHRLRPNNPQLRDLYASALLRAGKKADGLREISRSVEQAPAMSAHFYLEPGLLPWLSEDEKQAVESGFRRAVDQHVAGAVDNLAAFYSLHQRHWDRGQLLAGALSQAPSRAEKSQRAIAAARSFLAANATAKAERVLREAIATNPADPQPYRMLAEWVYSPVGNLQAVRDVIALGIGNAAPKFQLSLSLAVALHENRSSDEVDSALDRARAEIVAAGHNGNDRFDSFRALAETAARLGRGDRERQALEESLLLRPTSSDVLARLGQLYSKDQRFDRAAWIYQRFTQLEPQSADAHFQLGLAEERRFGFAAAEEAYGRAVALAPNIELYRSKHQELRQRIANHNPEPKP